MIKLQSVHVKKEVPSEYDIVCRQKHLQFRYPSPFRFVSAVTTLPLLGTDQSLLQLCVERVSKPTFVLLNSMGILSLNVVAALLDSLCYNLFFRDFISRSTDRLLLPVT